MESHKKNPDKLNTIGIITVGLVGAALVYLSIVGLQAFYVGETAIVDEVRSFGDQEKIRTSLKAEQVGRITSDLTRKGVTADNKPIVAIPIDAAKALIVRDARTDAANLVPIVGRSETTTIQPIFGRPVALPPPPPATVPPPADGAVPGAVPPADTSVPGATGTAPATGAPAPGTTQPAPGTTAPGTTTPGTAAPGTTPAPAVRPDAPTGTPPPATPPAQPRPPAAGAN